MASNKLNNGVGKKIVEALKMQSKVFEDNGIVQQPEVTPTPQAAPQQESTQNSNNNSYSVNGNTNETILPSQNSSNYNYQQSINTNYATSQAFIDSALQQSILQSFGSNSVGLENEMDEFNCPPNVAVVRQLIAKLPSGVTRQTGALIIKQTMEALGIPMQSVIQDAQQYRETLNNSAKECLANVVEYRKQISILEAKSQQYQRQSALMNDIISLFVRTNIR